ncbi:hypothetical protein I6A84_21870 [Frankia sp. CNm7]|uniref:histidine kinase n=1 Tax=Frankia nepalensis TaxID=1836974 RepID=A0A937RK91_9ACTN|nr:histidine kinase [Frankia nepalensis]MBL7500408.1 hypothetical protein [Frankia nepalensis]MBL7508706.1 hypothetical protein [Frankia nepalensis]MBL7520660.1 hypothetical protein [Frankia nepalensis]MBL7628869.1 hypothetical protein [Frankia nepalensis]
MSSRDTRLAASASRLRLLTVVLVTTAGAGGAALSAGWPYWRGHPASGVLHVSAVVSLMVAGVLLVTRPNTRACGLLALLAGLTRMVHWLSTWNVGVLPLLSGFGHAAHWLALGAALLLYPAGRSRSHGEALWISLAAVDLLGGNVVLVLTARPEWHGFDPAVVWPDIGTVDRDAYEITLDVLLVTDVLTALSFTALAVFRIRSLRGLDQDLGRPVLITACLVGLVGALAHPDLFGTEDAAGVPDSVAAANSVAPHNTVTALVPIALAVVVVRRRLVLATLADHLHRATRPATVEDVEASLRHVLRDDALRLYHLDTASTDLVDPVGQGGALDAARPVAIGAERWLLEVSAPLGGITALVDAEPGMREYRALVEAAVTAGLLALENARLRSRLRAQTGRLADARREITDVETRERVRIERELHDGLQQQLIALDMIAGMIQRIAVDPARERALAEIRRRLQAAGREVREIARGLHPVALDSGGLRSALEHQARHLRLPATLWVCAQRFSPGTEHAMYAVLAAALTTAASRTVRGPVQVAVWVAGSTLIGEVSEVVDAGRGLAPASGHETGYDQLAAVADQVRALGGSVSSARSESERPVVHRTTVILPCA